MIRLGIACSGMIVGTCLDTLQQLSDIKCISICARPQSKERMSALAAQYEIRHQYTDYAEMLGNKQIDCIYIGVSNHMHHTFAKEALLSGKAVILEKPFASTVNEADELIQLAKSRHLFLFEAITNQYCKIFAIMRKRLPELGAIKLVQCNFSQYSSRYDEYKAGVIRPVFDPKCSGGALFDLNIYNLHLVVGLFGSPQRISYAANLGANGIDTSGIVTMSYKGFQAACAAAKDSSSPSFVLVQGEKGFLHIKGPSNSCEHLQVVVDGKTDVYMDDRVRMAAELEAFIRMMRNGEWQESQAALKHTQRVLLLAELARKDAGIRFAADEFMDDRS